MMSYRYFVTGTQLQIKPSVISQKHDAITLSLCVII